MKLYRVIVTAVFLLTGVTGPIFNVQAESAPLMGQNELAMPVELHQEARNQLSLIQEQLDQDIAGYTNDQLLNWFAQVDNNLNGFLRTLGREQWKQGASVYAEYKNKLRNKFFNAGGKFPRSIKMQPVPIKAPTYPTTRK